MWALGMSAWDTLTVDSQLPETGVRLPDKEVTMTTSNDATMVTGTNLVFLSSHLSRTLSLHMYMPFSLPPYPSHRPCTETTGHSRVCPLAATLSTDFCTHTTGRFAKCTTHAV